jgi:hypothetical protein
LDLRQPVFVTDLHFGSNPNKLYVCTGFGQVSIPSTHTCRERERERESMCSFAFSEQVTQLEFRCEFMIAPRRENLF